VAITALVYGVVAVIVKMDDVGLLLAQRTSPTSQRIGRALVAAMPRLLALLSTIGIVAMLWVGGHILLVGMDELGLTWPYHVVHMVEEAVHEATGALGGILGWLTNTLGSALLGAIVGAFVVVVVSVVHRMRDRRTAAHA
jgi:predicted DNA repair protein MutK